MQDLHDGFANSWAKKKKELASFIGKANGAWQVHQVNKEGAAVPVDTEAMGAASRGGKLACKKSKRTMSACSNLNKKLEKKIATTYLKPGLNLTFVLEIVIHPAEHLCHIYSLKIRFK